ncbi:MAG TPA: HAMP domain-containing sensor histidine kinase [Bacteroidota bacterium]|nr:HAMP domain-containing sensor histidine kinase [Bacteroidota bacterium]
MVQRVRMLLRRPSVLLAALLLLVVLPALLVTAFELNRMSRGERELHALYTRQLDAVLFSVNQHAWDVANSWMRRLGSIDARGAGTTDALNDFRAGRRAVLYAAVLSADLRPLAATTSSDATPMAVLFDSLRARPERLEQLRAYAALDYLRIETLALPRAGHAPALALLGSATHGEQGAILVCLIDPGEFIREQLTPKFRELEGQDFILSARERRGGRIVASSAPAQAAGTAHWKPLWLLPEHDIGIRLRGSDIGERSRDRLLWFGVLLGVVDLLLIAGVLFVYVGMRREMRLAAMKTDFVSNVSHELKTPLALIRMFAETLEMDRVPDEARRREYYGIIVQESERLSRLINNILTFSRMEAGKKEYRLRDTDINSIVERVMGMYAFHLEHRGFACTFEAAPDPPSTRADEEAVAEAVINLLDNAMKYSAERKRVDVRTHVDGGYVCVAVRDEGIGIPPAEQRRIFEKFYRVSQGLSGSAKGSGLGLALVEHIMRAHGGEVRVDSTPGVGSCFTLCFPISHTHADTEERAHGAHTGDR